MSERIKVSAIMQQLDVGMLFDCTVIYLKKLTIHMSYQTLAYVIIIETVFTSRCSFLTHRDIMTKHAKSK